MPSFIPLEIAAIEEDGFHLMITARINGLQARMLVDTGASRSVFDKDRISRFFSDSPELEENMQKSTGLGTRDMTSQALFLDELAIGELKVRNYPAVVLDMSHVNESYAELGMEPIDGVIGSDILLKYAALIDYGKGIMRINMRRKRMTKKKSNV